MASAHDLEAIGREGRRLIEAARSDPDRTVPQYPSWTLRDLLAHTASMHARTTAICRTLPQERIPAPELPEGRDVFDWAGEMLDTMVEALSQADPDASVWTPIPVGRSWAWERRMVIETGLHRWDAQQAFGEPEPLLPLAARHGLDEFADMWLPRLGRVPTIEVSDIDSGLAWRFGAGQPSAVVDAAASDLFLSLMGRPGVRLPAEWERAVRNLAGPAS